MTGTASFSGIASGFDWRDMIDQLMQLESRPVAAARARLSLAESRTKAWTDFRRVVESLRDAARPLHSGLAFQRFQTTLGGVAAGTGSPLDVAAGVGARPGTYQVRVLATASHEKLGGAYVADRGQALGLEGEFLVNGRAVRIEATDTLDDVASRINRVNAGVAAAVVSTGPGAYRLVLTSERSGAAGIDLRDGPGAVLRGLGIVDGTQSLKHALSAGARSDGFSDSTTPLAALLGLSAPPVPGTVRIGGLDVELDLATMSLDEVAAAIDAAATAAGSGVRARVVEATEGGTTTYHLEITGTTTFSDANGILELIGILESGRGAVAQELRGRALTVGGQPATLATSFAELGARPGDTLTVAGTRGDGSTFSFTFEIVDPDAETIAAFLEKLNGEDGLGGGDRTATATLDVEGRITVTDDTAGGSRLALSIVAHNEGGGALDFGRFDVARHGFDRVLARGRDAELEVDGMYLTRPTNTISDVVPGLTLNLLAASPETDVTVTVDRDVDAIAGEIRKLVAAYNTLVDFVVRESARPAEGQQAKPLSGDTTLRAMRARLFDALQSSLESEAANAFTRLADIGISIGRDGRYTVDGSALEAALRERPDEVARLLGGEGGAAPTAQEEAAPGILTLLLREVDAILGPGGGSIQSVIDGIDGQLGAMRDRIATLEDRVERRREELVRRFTAMEMALARAQSQSQWLAAQIALYF